MPYIEQKDRDVFEAYLQDIQGLVSTRGLSNGEFNYLISTIAEMYLAKHGLSYNIIKDIVGGFECAKLEFYRRIAVPYEDKKIEQNGDVY